MAVFEEPLLYEKAYSVVVNHDHAPLFYLFDYDERSFNINMEFQHFHQFYEIFVLVDEKASHIIEGDYYDLQKYDMVFLKPARLHKSEYPPGPPRKRLIINFSAPREIPGLDRSLETIFSIFDPEIPIYRFPPGNIRNLLFSKLNEIFSLGKQHMPQSDVVIHSKFLEFLWLLSSHRKANTYEYRQPADSIIHKIYAITSFIHGHFSEPLSLETISDQFFISMYYLSRQFRKVTGFTLVNYIQMTRIRNAQQLLLYTNIRIKDITERCGFTSFSQFNRVFNKFCKVSPSEFRRLGKEEDASILSLLSLNYD